MLLTDVKPYDSDVLHLSISTKFTGDANFCQTAEACLFPPQCKLFRVCSKSNLNIINNFTA